MTHEQITKNEESNFSFILKCMTVMTAKILSLAALAVVMLHTATAVATPALLAASVVTTIPLFPIFPILGVGLLLAACCIVPFCFCSSTRSPALATSYVTHHSAYPQQSAYRPFFSTPHVHGHGGSQVHVHSHPSMPGHSSSNHHGHH